ncbi:general amino acid permease [Moniliophthora roreri MCA 2997]|uniref:General amino acid permease n=1 Tax=Moniliophthora roreri (strain MCA 2997) TaxID=1381753 RepID=V2XBI9_MONRO|nr:general amino acid permease [Moniliophthora roreri MCA 2997]
MPMTKSNDKPEKSEHELDVLSHHSPEDSYRDDQTHRKLKSRHIQLIGIGGTIGTALFVQIGSALTKGGPASLFLGFTIWCTFILAVNNCLSEMVTWIPISAPFVRFADRFVDPALGFCTGINFFVYESFLIPFEIVAFNVILHFWTDKIPIIAVICFMLIAYAALNFINVKYYGEAEFWLAFGKVVLAVGFILFTFITMVGGNPLHDVYGFRFWNPSKVEGAPFAEYIETGPLGRFMGFLACFTQAGFTVAGPDMVSLTAGEAETPRRILPRTFNAVVYRLVAFFVLGSLCIGTVVAYNDENLLQSLSDARPGAGSSPYVIAMQRLKIPVLPHIVNFMILVSVFSAGNSYVYCASRTLLGLALEGKVPAFFVGCNRNGVPIYCVALTLSIALLSFLQVSNNSAVVLQWFVNLVTASQLLNYAIVSFTYIRFYNALKAQNISRESLPYKSAWQPFCGYYALTGTFIMAFIGGYTVFLPGKWDVPTFLFSYAMIGVVPVLFVAWKLYHRTQWRQLKHINFFDKEREVVDRYEKEFDAAEEPKKRLDKLWAAIFPS